MERPKNLKKKHRSEPKYKKIIAITVIVLFHVVGLIGLIIPSTSKLFLTLVPWHLLLMLVVILLSHRQFDFKFISFALSIFILGFAVEWIGVHTGWLFGSYDYGLTLGIKLWGIPLMIGVNWFLLVYCAGAIMQRTKFNIFARILSGAAILTLMDFLIEPVAIKFDYWHWDNNDIPDQNYLVWFLFSALLLFLFEKFELKRQSIVPMALLLTQFVFFAILNFMF